MTEYDTATDDPGAPEAGEAEAEQGTAVDLPDLTPDEELAAYRTKYGPLAVDEPDATTGTTHVLMITDMSGSMAFLADDVRGGFNAYVADLATQPGTYRITATLFDERYMPLCADVDLLAVPKLTRENYSPAGTTALLDAVGKTIGNFETRVHLGERDRVLVVIQTDGHENASREWTYDAIRKLTKGLEAAGKWTFIYLGAGADTWEQASRMGVQASNYVNTAATSHGTASTYSGLTQASVAFASGASGPETARRIADAPGSTEQQ